MHRRTWTACLLIAAALFGGRAARAQNALADVLVENSDWELVAEGFKFLEGPAVDANGILYFSDIPTSKIYRLDSSGQPEVFVATSEATNGLMFGPDGRLYGCQTGKQRIVAFDSQAKATEVRAGILGNDLVVLRNGDIYVTDPENKFVTYIPKRGQEKIVDRGLLRPNGIALWPGEDTLVVSDTLGEHVWAFQIQPDGLLTNKERFYHMLLPPDKSTSGADGIAIDTQNRLYVATYLGVQVFDSQGRLIGVIPKPQNAFLSNLKFAGPKFDTLYATCTDRLYRRKTKATGVH